MFTPALAIFGHMREHVQHVPSKQGERDGLTMIISMNCSVKEETRITATLSYFCFYRLMQQEQEWGKSVLFQ